MDPKLPTRPFDRAIGSMTMRNDVVRTDISVKRVTDAWGNTRTFNVQTYREERTEGTSAARDTVFIEETGGEEGFKQIVLPPEVTEIIARQRDVVETKMRRKGAAKAMDTKKSKARSK